MEGELVARLRRESHDVAYVPETSAGISDDEVLARTNAEGRVLLTEDKAFGDLGFSRPLASCRSSGSSRSTKPGGSRPSSWMDTRRGGLPGR